MNEDEILEYYESIEFLQDIELKEVVEDMKTLVSKIKNLKAKVDKYEEKITSLD